MFVLQKLSVAEGSSLVYRWLVSCRSKTNTL